MAKDGTKKSAHDEAISEILQALGLGPAAMKNAKQRLRPEISEGLDKIIENKDACQREKEIARRINDIPHRLKEFRRMGSLVGEKELKDAWIVCR